MSYQHTEEHEMFRKAVAAFVDKEVIPIADKLDEEGGIPREFIRHMGELGYLGLKYPERYGGSEADTTMLCILCEELCRGSMSVAMAVGGQALMNTYFIYRYGNEEQKQRCLVPAIRGEKIGAWALTEPNTGSDLSGMQTMAVKDGDAYVVNGTKTWVTCGALPDFVTLAARTEKGEGLAGIGLFLIEQGTPGFTIGRRIEKLGVRSSEARELILENCRIPRENLLGGEGKGVEYINTVMSEARVMTGALSLGVARAAYEAALNYSKERVQFGKPIGKFQAIKFKLAEMATDVEAAHHLVYHTAWLCDQGVACRKEAAMAKLFASEMAVRVTDEACRIYASYGFAMEYGVQRFFRDARFTLIGGGTSEIMKLIVGKELGL